jgi:hypothetical protein
MIVHGVFHFQVHFDFDFNTSRTRKSAVETCGETGKQQQREMLS